MVASKKTGHFSQLLFDDVEKINADQDYWFQLRDNLSNVFIDAATPLFGLSMRVRTLSHCETVGEIYQQAVNEVKAIEISLTEQGVDPATLMAYRYVLCAFLDEAVLGTEWGASSEWAEHSMLSRFHNETWGGEKVFSILGRLETDVHRYRELLEFIYHCLILGFEGKYRVMDGGSAEREKVIVHLYELLKEVNGTEHEVLTGLSNKAVKSKYNLTYQIPIWAVLAGFTALCGGAFVMYSYFLNSKSSDILIQLNQIL